MIRKVAALLGIGVILAVVGSLLWAVHQHKMKTDSEQVDDVISANTAVRERQES